jgi:predicted AlkP superfamily phosphohydrolase/phosphomutase
MVQHSEARNRVIMIGVDTARPDQIDRYCSDGTMPALQRLRENGAWGSLESVSNYSSGAIWPSLVTGHLPHRHGQYFTHMQLANGTYHIVKRYADDLKGSPFWNAATSQGRHVAVVDVPQTRPAENFSGIHITGWGGEFPGWPPDSWPKELMNEVYGAIGKHPIVHGDPRIFIKPATREEYRAVTTALLDGMEKKRQLLIYLMEKEPWDLFLTVLPETHWAMHVLCHLLEADHPDHKPEFDDEFGDFFDCLFAKQDEVIADLVTRAPEANFIVFSGSGMWPNYTGSHLLPQVIAKLGLGPNGAVPPEDASDSPKSKGWAYYRIRRLQDTFGMPLIQTAKHLIPERMWDKWTRRLVYPSGQWAKSRAFVVPNDCNGSIRINLKGREPNGLVEPSEYEALCDMLEQELAVLENVASGKPAVETIIRTRRELNTDQADDLPDIIVTWAGDAPKTGFRSPRIGTVLGEDPERRSGRHHPEGFVVMSGPGIVSTEKLADAQLLDLPPTVLSLLGVEPDEGLDGRILPVVAQASARNPVAK